MEQIKRGTPQISRKFSSIPTTVKTKVEDFRNRRAEFAKFFVKHQDLLDRIPTVNDLQSAWLLLIFGAATRANFSSRSVPPQLALEFAMTHDANVWECFCRLLDFNPEQITTTAMAVPRCRSVGEV